MRKHFAQLACLLALGAGALPLVGCSMPEKHHIEAQPPVAGGAADVTAVMDRDQNVTKLKIRAHHLAEPGQAAPNATSYVAWVRGAPGQPQGTPTTQNAPMSGSWRRLGVLDYDPKDQDGKLSVTTPERNFELMITAETSTDPAQPSRHVVFQRMIEAQY